MVRKLRTEGDLIRINEWLLPLSWLYGLLVGLRNLLFDWGILRERSFNLPVIGVGNITVGGSGKTPHVEYLVQMLSQYFQVGVLSRGYKRKSKGYVLANMETPMEQIGDEPFQMVHKFPKTYVAVDRNRCHGLDTMMQDPSTSDVDVVVLDDAFQHRYVKPGINILLVDYHRLIIYDKLLPAGRLRESLRGKSRADMVIITKCPRDLKPMEYRVLTKAMALFPYQQLYFTTVEYAPLKPALESPSFSPSEKKHTRRMDWTTLRDKHVLLLTGIASPQQMVNDLRPHCRQLKVMSYPDHHAYTVDDAKKISEAFLALPSPRIAITTEKDMARLVNIDGLCTALRQSIYTLPIHIAFMQGQEETFHQNIISYVRKNSRNSILAKGKDDYKPTNSHRAGNRPGTISF